MLQHAEIHANCICYQKGDVQSIAVKMFAEGDSAASLLTSHHIIIVLAGQVRYSITGTADVTVTTGQMIFLPIATNMTWLALENSTVMLVRVSHFVGKLPECHTFRFQRLSSGDDMQCMDNEHIHVLTMNSRIKHFVRGVVDTERDGLKCRNYARHLVAQLLTLIQVYYTVEEYTKFYSTVVSPDVVFTDKVFEQWRDCRSVGEMANSLGVTAQQFILHFRRVFGENPGAWLKKRRMEEIYRDICSSHKTLRQIATDNKLSMTNFVRYCRMNFKATPGAIRESLSIKVASPRENTK